MDYSPDLKACSSNAPPAGFVSALARPKLIHADIPYYVSGLHGILDALDEAQPLVEGADLGDIYIGLADCSCFNARHDALCARRLCRRPADFRRPASAIGENKIHVYLAASFSPPAAAKYSPGTGHFLKI